MFAKRIHLWHVCCTTNPLLRILCNYTFSKDSAMLEGAIHLTCLHSTERKARKVRARNVKLTYIKKLSGLYVNGLFKLSTLNEY